MDHCITLNSLLSALGGMAALQFLVTLWLSERFKAALQRETGKFIESVRWELKAREQAAKVAEYLALAKDLKPDSPAEDYRNANRLSWEMALWLPPDVYRSMTKALAAPDKETNALSVVVRVRHVLLGKAAGDLTQEEIAHHGPNIGKRT
jgi:hypothetical protein